MLAKDSMCGSCNQLTGIHFKIKYDHFLFSLIAFMFSHGWSKRDQKPCSRDLNAVRTSSLRDVFHKSAQDSLTVQNQKSTKQQYNF